MSLITVDYGTVGGDSAEWTQVSLSATSTEYEIDTKKSNLQTFTLKGYSSIAANVIFWSADDSTHWMGAGSAGGSSSDYYYGAFTSSARARLPVIESITDGVVKIKSPSTADWSSQLTYEWIAT